MPPSEVVALLDGIPHATLWALAAVTEDEGVRELVADYVTRLSRLRPRLTGDDVLRLGALRGPLVGEVLARLREAKLDGVVKTRAQEEAFVRRALAERGG